MKKSLWIVFIVFSLSLLIQVCYSATMTSQHFRGGDAKFTNMSAGQIKTGNFIGNVTGNVIGNITGNTVGNVTGNLTGIVNGNRINAALFANLSTAVNSATTAGKTIEVSSPVTCNTLTVLSNRSIDVVYGGSINQSGTLTINGPFSAPLTQVFTGTGVVTGLKEAYPDWWTSNAIPGTTDMAAAWNKATAAATVIKGADTYAVSDTVLVGDGRTITGNCTLKAITGMANKPIIMIKEGDGSTVAWGVDIDSGVTIDGNDIALTGIEAYYARSGKLHPNKITRVNKYGILLGDAGAADVSTDIHVYGTVIWYHESGSPVLKTASYANPADSIGVYYRNCTDSRVINTTAVGFRVGFQTAAASGSIDYTQAHAWNRRAHGPLLAAFRSYGSNGSYEQCYADTPNNWYSADGTNYTQDAAITAVYGFYIDSYSQALVNCKVYMNTSVSFGATDELLTAVHFAKAEYGHIFGLQIKGAHADYQYLNVYGGTTSNVTIIGTGIPASGTLKNASTVFDQVGLRRINFAPTLLAIDGAAATVREMEISTAGLARWRLGGNNTAEAGTNAGTDFAIRSYNDAGSILYTPMTVTRSTGYVTLSRVPTYANNTDAIAGGLTAGQLYKTGGGTVMIVY
jgi:hypothetical protein